MRDLDRLSDADAVRRSRVDGRAFVVLFDRHYDAVFRYLARRIGRDDAEDLAAETFERAFDARGRYRPETATALPWLLGIAIRLLWHRRRDEDRRWRAYADVGRVGRGEDVDLPDADGRDVDRRLAAAVAALAQGDRDALLLYAWGGLSYEEIAAALGIPTGTVRSRLHRARRAVRDVLEATDLDVVPAPCREETHA